MTDIQTILTTKFPKTDERIEGHLVFLDQYGVDRIRKTNLENVTSLDFYKAKFYTGHRKFTIIETIIGLSGDSNVFLLTNPLFSDKHSDIVNQLERIDSMYVTQSVILEIIDLYKETGASITEIGNDKYQIWHGENKWRIMEFENNRTLKIKTTPNSTLQKTGLSWWRRHFGSE
jgi:hypothetical protein